MLKPVTLKPAAVSSVREAANDLLDDARRVHMPALEGCLAVASEFLGEPDQPKDPLSPLRSTLGASKGWQRATRLKVLLLMLWLHTNQHPRDTDEPYVPVVGHKYARALAMSDPDTTGARDVNAAVAELEALGFVRTARSQMRRGRRREFVELLSETSSDEPRRRPDLTRCVKFGNAIVTHGWLAALSGRALAALLVHAHTEQLRPPHPDVRPYLWLPKGQRTYGITTAQLITGSRELSNNRLMKRSSVKPKFDDNAQLSGPLTKSWPKGYRFVSTVPWLSGLNAFERSPWRAATKKPIHGLWTPPLAEEPYEYEPGGVSIRGNDEPF